MTRCIFDRHAADKSRVLDAAVFVGASINIQSGESLSMDIRHHECDSMLYPWAAWLLSHVSTTSYILRISDGRARHTCFIDTPDLQCDEANWDYRIGAAVGKAISGFDGHFPFKLDVWCTLAEFEVFVARLCDMRAEPIDAIVDVKKTVILSRASASSLARQCYAENERFMYPPWNKRKV